MIKAISTPASSSPAEVTGTDYKRNVFACVTVAQDGKMSKQFIEEKDPEFRLMLEKSFTEINNQFVVMAIKTKKALTEEHLFNHASFRLSTVETR